MISLKELSGKKFGKVKYCPLQGLEDLGVGSISRLPFSIRILLESVLRNCDGFVFTEEHVKTLAGWKPLSEKRPEMPYKPARVVLQDFTGVPAIVDLAAMRDAMKRLGGNPAKINPLVRCDLVIDHSVQVDYFGTSAALAKNEEVEFQRNRERYEFLKWGQLAFSNLRVVPPSTGIIHQVNLEYLSEGIYWNRQANVVYPDSCVGTDSHTTMVNGLGVLAWGVGGIEAEAVMLDQPIYMLVPDVVGIKLLGEMPDGTTATDLVLAITELCRSIGVVEKFVEFFGPGLNFMSVADRATVGNMAPEQGSTVSFFPVDDLTLQYLRESSRSEELVALTEAYYKSQGLFREASTPDPEFSRVVELDLSNIVPCVAGPKRPQDRVALSNVASSYRASLLAPVGSKGFGLQANDLERKGVVKLDNESEEISHGAVVIAAITSCTNTSNPASMIAAGLVAKKAVERGLTVKPYVKTSLAPGSTVVTDYLKKAGLLAYLEKIGFFIVGYGCTTCIGNSGPLPEAVEKAIVENDLVVSAVLSGNRNFEGRVHPLTRANYLASPPLVVVYALAGSTAKDVTTEPIGIGSDGNAVYLRDIWPSSAEIAAAVREAVLPEMFKNRYADVFKGSDAWQRIETKRTELYSWDESSTYIQEPPFFTELSADPKYIKSICNARVLACFGDSVTTDHISPAGSMAKNSPAAVYLKSLGVKPEEYNSYGSRRGNYKIMMRGTFANVRIKNALVPGVEGNVTVYHDTGEQMSFFDAAERYREKDVPLIVLAGKEYGSGSSRDWAAKGPFLLGVKAVIAESYERIHRSNLIGMGILPLEFMPGENAKSLGLNGDEIFDIILNDLMKPRETIAVLARSPKGGEKTFNTISRIDAPVEIQYYRDGGILCTVLKNLLNQ